VQPLLVRHLDFTHESHFKPIAARLELAVPPRQMLGEHVKTIFVEVPVSLDTDEDEGGTPTSIPLPPLPTTISSESSVKLHTFNPSP
jgi:hypothetical protein